MGMSHPDRNVVSDWQSKNIVSIQESFVLRDAGTIVGQGGPTGAKGHLLP